MRSSLIAIVALASVAPATSRADDIEDDDITLPRRATVLGLETLTADIASGHAGGIGPFIGWMRDRGRVGAFVEAGAGLLSSSRPRDHLGAYASGRVGGRVLATSYEGGGAAFRLLLDAGIGVDEMWLRGSDPWMRPDAFVGWTSMLGAKNAAMLMTIRLEASPTMTDASVLRAVCGGPCTMPSDAPVDITLMLSMGITSW